jgi:hypothetical protein
MNTTLLLMLAVPMILAGGMFYLNREYFAREFRAGALTLVLPGLMLPGFLIVITAFALAHGSAVSDTEIWSGVVTGKDRVHDRYTHTYSCNCTTDAKGNSSCQTCSEEHYTVKWFCRSSVGQFTIDEKDSTRTSVYDSPNPARYTSIVIGEPAARTNTYTNYIQAVPDTLFKPVDTNLKAKFKGLIPKYPDQIYDVYRIDRFVTVGFNFTDAALWNQGISNMLRTLGPSKQANIIVVVAKTADPMYMYALRDAWEGANKNDVVLILGSEDGQKIEWADVISWTKNELFKVELRDAALALGVIQREQVLSLLQMQISKNFERRHMSEFEYLSNEITPPDWFIIMLLVVLCAGYGGGALYLKRNSGRRY